MLTILLAYAAVGVLAGVLAGLFGIGGGLVIVPLLIFAFTRQAVPQDIMMHLALGTSMASIMFTAISSFLAHHRRGAVRWDIVRRITAGILLGTLLGATVAARLPTVALKGFFALFLYYVCYTLLLGKKPKPSRQLPGNAGMFGMGNLIGVVSSWVGIGGGTLSVPFMLWCNVPPHTAVGTSAAIGFPIAVAGTVGYVVNGLAAPGLPDWSAGFVYLPALAGIVAASVLTAPLGVRLAHALPVDKLKRAFAILLLLVATRMAWSVFF
jgi:uncharacterized membrane protein YfcA